MESPAKLPSQLFGDRRTSENNFKREVYTNAPNKLQNHYEFSKQKLNAQTIM